MPTGKEENLEWLRGCLLEAEMNVFKDKKRLEHSEYDLRCLKATMALLKNNA